MEYLGKGIYTISQVAQITKIDPSRVRRWIKGYTFSKSTNNYKNPPMFSTDYKYDSSDVIVSFLDFMEILFIDSFTQFGISLQSIRKAAQIASRLFSSSHPFAMKKIFTDGKSILAQIAEESGESDLIDLLKKQYQLEDILLPYLYECIDFNKLDLATKFWPLGKQSSIVLDPNRSLGQPIIHKYNVRTNVLYDLAKHGNTIKDIAEWYEIDEISIQNAIDFEKGLVA
jgi:uncharacterized protein (DUF433 family)/DNA-binding transcriptional MerR regulator